MRAIRVHDFGGPEVMREEDVADPVAGPGEVLIQIKAAGVNPVDTYVRSGAYERLPELPYIPGGDGAGTVAEVGEGVTRFRSGDRVYVAGGAGGALTGSCATLTTKPESQVYPLPAAVSFEQGAAIGVPYATAYRALFHKAEARSGDRVFVHGASGGVGLAAVQLAVAAKLSVIGTGSSQTGRDVVRQQGAELVLDHRAPDYLDELMEWTEGRGADVVLEMVAHVNLGKDLTVAARGGRVVIVGSRGPVEINPRDALVKDLTIRGFALASASAEEMDAIHRALVEGMESGALRPVVGDVIPFREAARAHLAVVSSGGVPGKVVLVP